MKYEEIIIEKREYELLRQIISNADHNKDKTYKASIEKLTDELKSATIINNENMPIEVVRFNSIVTVQMPFGEPKSFQIVTPDKSDISKNKLSILAPMGLALFGYAVSDEIMWQFPSGINAIKILNVEQPDALQKE
ncbi:regulator of nucleoside diphosphate kinase [Flavobacterium gossypii]|uniref:Regulator of nucleoside diphosphate kinase n=2 Tax=Flavobacterium TaxID=237 RepID=A0A495M6U7_9FLAO|nr:MULTISPECIES: GreA/GreB family elongation factor [Flavobacterium]MBA9075048.1 regulator of nucleoside diphosphate kinase [Flavobacterium gossypii]RKS20373.1 regulator of nucleoside diphosphate kinase [Flavobacterium endophyticum]